MPREGPPDVSDMHTLKVDNLTFRTSVEDLKDAFGKYGDVGDVYIPRHYGSGDPKGYAFVRFYDLRDAEDAMSAMEGKDIDGRSIRIQMARRKRPEDPRGYYASRGRYDDRGGRDSYRSRRYSRSRSGSRDRYHSRRDRRRYSRSRSRSDSRRRRRDSRDNRSRSRDSRRRNSSVSRSRSPHSKRSPGRDRAYSNGNSDKE